MKTNLKWLLGLYFIFTFSKGLQATIFEYSKNVYGLDPASCQQEAISLAKKLSQATGGTTEAAYCASLIKGGFDIRVLTDAQAEPELEKAIFGFGLIEYHYPGQKGPINKRYSVVSDAAVYVKLEECLKALPAYESIFHRETGLSPVAAQCARQSDYRYVAQVDAIGKASRHFYEINLDLGSSRESKEGLLDVTNYLSANGATPVTAAPPSSYLQIKYFGNYEVKLSSFDFERKNHFLSAEECSDAVTIVGPSLLKLASSKLVSIHCGDSVAWNPKGASSMGAIFDISEADAHAPKFDVFTYGQYTSYAECRNQIPTLSDSYCSADIDIYGHFNGYALNVIRTKTATH